MSSQRLRSSILTGVLLDYLTQIMAGGTVSIDATAENLRTCSFSCLDPQGILTPIDPNSGQLQPDGVEIQVFAGYLFENEVTMYSQGIFLLIETDVVSGSTSRRRVRC